MLQHVADMRVFSPKPNSETLCGQLETVGDEVQNKGRRSNSSDPHIDSKRPRIVFLDDDKTDNILKFLRDSSKALNVLVDQESADIKEFEEILEKLCTIPKENIQCEDLLDSNISKILSKIKKTYDGTVGRLAARLVNRWK